MRNESFTTTSPGGNAPTTFHGGPRPQPTGAVPAVGGKPAGPVVVKTGAQNGCCPNCGGSGRVGIPGGGR